MQCIHRAQKNLVGFQTHASEARQKMSVHASWRIE